MLPILRVCSLALCTTLFSLQGLRAQDQINVMSYNMLNYINTSYADFRADTIAKIFIYYKPDLFLMQELKQAAALDSLLAKAFNTSPGDNYEAVPFRPQVSAPWLSPNFRQQQGAIYNANKLTLLVDTFITTQLRDHNVFQFLINDPELELHGDSTTFWAVSSHLKASQGAANQNQRLNETIRLMNFLDSLGPEAHVIFGGDFNLYTADEPAYQYMLAGTESGFHFVDPIDSPGSWHLNPAFADIHTQSTRTFIVNNDGAGGGMDDRFDFILVSPKLMEPSNRIRYIEGSYENIGNSGNCFNDFLMNCTGGAVPQWIRHALWQMSDHLPIKLELAYTLPFTANTDAAAELPELKGANPVREQLRLQLPSGIRPGTPYTVYSIMGQVLHQDELRSTGMLDVPVSSLPAGWYILSLDEGGAKPFRFLKL